MSENLTYWQKIFYSVELSDIPSFRYIRKVTIKAVTRNGLEGHYTIKSEDELADYLGYNVHHNGDTILSFSIDDVDIRTRNLKNDVSKIKESVFAKLGDF